MKNKIRIKDKLVNLSGRYISNRRVFNGKTYDLYSAGHDFDFVRHSKTDAEKIAKEIRKQGYLVRIVPGVWTGSAVFTIYIREE